MQAEPNRGLRFRRRSSPRARFSSRGQPPVWLVLALINMWIGVSRAGYSVSEELPIFVAIFGLPGLSAAFVWWKFS
jgi:hypothetical protein